MHLRQIVEVPPHRSGERDQRENVTITRLYAPRRVAEHLLAESYGELDADPELAYQGPVLGILDLAGALFEEVFEGVSLFEELAAPMDEFLDAVEGSFEPAEGSDFDQLDGFAGASDSNGFVVVRSRTGLMEQIVYSFRRGGWDYAVAQTWGRPSSLDDAGEYDSNAIVLRAPDGTVHRLSGG